MSDIFAAYVAGAASQFYADHFADAADRRRAVARAARPLTADVAAVLERQNARLAPSPARDAHLAALRRGAAAVVTGQQVGLFLGPLFNLYKAASAIVAARLLARETGETVVPVFWLQTEDHDLPEIAECNVPCAAGTPVALRLPASMDDRISVAHRRLPAEVGDRLEQLRAEIGNLPHAATHLERLARHYRPRAGWADAFVGAMAELFAEEGLVFINPRDADLGAAAAAIHRTALVEADGIAAALLERRRALEVAGFAAGVHVRPGAPLSFFHPRGVEGPRYRLEPASGGFAEVGGDGVHAPSALFEALAAEPLRFSTSVLLRPILQDTLLPTAAYVGGPAEVAYFAQLAPLYRAYGMTMPLIVPRARLGIVDAGTARLLARLGVDASLAREPEEAILAAASVAGRERLDVAAPLLDAFDATVNRLRARIEAAGPGLDTALEKTRASVEAAVTRLAAKVDAALLHGDAERLADVRRLKLRLYPNGVPQERVYGFAYLAARYGERPFLERLLAEISPFDATPLNLSMPDDDLTEEGGR